MQQPMFGEKKCWFCFYYIYFVGLSDYPWWFVLFLSFISQFLDIMISKFVPLICCVQNAQMDISTLFGFNFANVEWPFLFFCYMWHTSLCLLFNIHFVLGLACGLPLMETMQFFLNFVQKGDIFICDFIVVVIVCQGLMYILYCNTTLSFQNNEFWSCCRLL